MRFDRRELVAVFVGGFIGTVARAELAQSLPTRPGEWPWAITRKWFAIVDRITRETGLVTSEMVPTYA